MFTYSCSLSFFCSKINNFEQKCSTFFSLFFLNDEASKRGNMFFLREFFWKCYKTFFSSSLTERRNKPVRLSIVSVCSLVLLWLRAGNVINFSRMWFTKVPNKLVFFPRQAFPALPNVRMEVQSLPLWSTFHRLHT